jgi:hypothetical protein
METKKPEMVVCPETELEKKRAFLKLPKTERQRILKEQAEILVSQYSAPASVPLPPDELLTELREQLAEIICKKFVAPQALKQKFSDMPFGARQYYLDIADSVLLKYHQSEAAKIKQLELGKKLSIESDNRIEQAIGKVLGYPAYKDDQKNFPNATEANGVCVGDHVAESLVMELVGRFKELERINSVLEQQLILENKPISEAIKEARADQNKKIGKWLRKNYKEKDSVSLELFIRDLQKGVFSDWKLV